MHRCHQIRPCDQWIELHTPFYQNMTSYKQRKGEQEKASRKVKEVKGVKTAYLSWTWSWQIRHPNQIERSATASNITPLIWKYAIYKQRKVERGKARWKIKKWRGYDIDYLLWRLISADTPSPSNQTLRPLDRTSRPPSFKIRNHTDR